MKKMMILIAAFMAIATFSKAQDNSADSPTRKTESG